MALQFVNEAEIEGKNVIARFDFNVPLENGNIIDSTRIDLALETIQTILSQGPNSLILMSHLGRPKGEVRPELSLEPIAKYLADKLDEDVTLTESCLDSGIKTLQGLKNSRVILLENLRFHPEETSNSREFAQVLASYADIYVNDAFGAAHRKHASTYEINASFKGKSYAGLLLQKELEALNNIVESPKKPMIAIIGGAKVSDKIKTIEKLMVTVKNILIGGAMAYPFLKAQGHNIGKSLCSDEDVKLAKSLLNQDKGNKLVFPIDHITSKEFGGSPIPCSEVNIPDEMMGLDIGPKTIELYKEKISQGKTLFWNGPMGLFENNNYAKGTMSIAEQMADLDAYTLVGGGDSVAAVNKSGQASKFSHVSTGGGASLEYIEHGSLPGVQALKFGVE